MFLETPYYSVRHWNACRGNENIVALKDDDVELKRPVDLLNTEKGGLNSDNQVVAPKLNIDLAFSSGKKNKTEYTIHWKHLIDGIHLRKLLSVVWLYKLLYYMILEEKSA